MFDPNVGLEVVLAVGPVGAIGAVDALLLAALLHVPLQPLGVGVSPRTVRARVRQALYKTPRVIDH